MVSALMFTSCAQKENSDINPDDRELSIDPVKSNGSQSPLEVLGVYDVEGGNLYVYKFGNDTIYWAEGRSSSYPVGLQVK